MFFGKYESFDAKEYDKFYYDIEKNLQLGISPNWFCHDSIAPFNYMPDIFAEIFFSDTMQKSKEKSQTSFCYKVNPRMGLCSRYDHMRASFLLGVDLLIILDKKGYQIDAKTKAAFLAFLATHDIGHGPFSHPFELMVDGYKGMHEVIGKRAILNKKDVYESLDKIYPLLPFDVANFKSTNTLGLYSLLEGIFDLDRAAFMIMDTYESNFPNSAERRDKLVEAIYNIFDSIVLTDHKVLFTENALPDIELFLREREKNYDKLYLNSCGGLYDTLLHRIGTKMGTFDVNDLDTDNEMIKNKVEEFIAFLESMKKDKEKVDLDLYFSYGESFFFDVFNYLLLNNSDEELFLDCLVAISPIEIMESLYEIKEYDSNEALESSLENDNILFSKVKIKTYESTEEENITLLTEDGRTVDYGDHPKRTLDISPKNRFYVYRMKDEEEISIEEEQKIQQLLELNIRKYLIDNYANFLYYSSDSLKSVEYKELAQISLFLQQGGTLFDYAIHKGVSIKSIALPIFMTCKDPYIKECTTIMMLPSNRIKNLASLVTFDNIEDKNEAIKKMRQTIIDSQEDTDDETLRSCKYIRDNLIITDDSSNFMLIYKPLLRTLDSRCDECKKELDTIISKKKKGNKKKVK